MGEYVSNLCRNCGDKTDSSKSCTEFIIAFVAVSFLKVFILIVKYNLRIGRGARGVLTFGRLETAVAQPHSVSEDMASWLGRGAD